MYEILYAEGRGRASLLLILENNKNIFINKLMVKMHLFNKSMGNFEI